VRPPLTKPRVFLSVVIAGFAVCSEAARNAIGRAGQPSQSYDVDTSPWNEPVVASPAARPMNWLILAPPVRETERPFHASTRKQGRET
jgi:hypothetical protein